MQALQEHPPEEYNQHININLPIAFEHTADGHDATDDTCSICIYYTTAVPLSEEEDEHIRQECMCRAEPAHVVCKKCYAKLIRICSPAYFTPGTCPECNMNPGIADTIAIIRDPYSAVSVREKQIAALHADGAVLPLIADRTHDMYNIAVQSNGSALMHVPREYHNRDLYMKAGKDLRNTYYGYFDAAYTHMFPEYIEDHREFVIKYPMYFYNILEEDRSEDLIWAIITRYVWALSFLPRRYLTRDMWEYGVKRDPSVFEFMPARYMTAEIVERIIPARSRYIEFVPDYLKTYALCLIAVKQFKHYFIYPYIPVRFRTDELMREIAWADSDDGGYESSGCELCYSR